MIVRIGAASERRVSTLVGKRVVVNLVRNGLGVIQQWTRSARRKVGAAAKCLQQENEDAGLFLGN